MLVEQPRFSMSTQGIRFYHRGELVDVSGVHPTRSVLDWLREDAHCTGTKEGCNEGDCGACTVVIGELPGPHTPASQVVGGLALHTVNACIQFLPTLAGKALFTVEDLKDPASGALHPVQQAMVDCHGSQCGFCTPGFVMSLWDSYQRHRACGAPPTRRELADELSGNLCRCTGYRPILDAGQRMFELPAVPLDTAPVLAALRGLQGGDGLHYAGFNRQRAGAPRVDDFFAPRSLDALAALLEQHPKATLLAGSTDIGLWVNKQFRDLGAIVYLGDVAELKRIAERDGHLHIGAGASLEDAWAALAQRIGGLTEVWLRFASPPIRHAGTMGGNVANGSPIGDSAPVLLALDAELVLRRGSKARRVPLASFYVDYMKSLLQPGEFVQEIVVPLAVAARHTRAYKISKRFDCDISAVCAGLSIELDAGGAVAQVRLAYGGMAAIVKRAAGAEAVLQGRTWDEAALQAAQQALAEDFKPLTDMRASAAYRLQVAQNLLRRFWLETRATDALPQSATSVWSAAA